MKHYAEVQAKPDFVKLEKEVLKFWDDDQTFEKLADTGYVFDTTEFDKQKSGTQRSPYKIGKMWEFPLATPTIPPTRLVPRMIPLSMPRSETHPPSRRPKKPT